MELDLYSASLMLMLRAKCHYYSDEAMYDYVMHHLYNHVPGKQIDRALDGIHLRDYLQTLYQETIKKH